MKKFKKMIVTLLTLSLMLGMNAMSVSAKEYTYTITLHAGDKGAINGVEGGYEEITGCLIGSQVTFDLSKVTVTDEKYYIKGVRLSGHDNEEVAPAFTVDGDADYVVAYGIKGDMVGYTVNYQDEEGKELAPSDTFYGNIGDKPVVAYKYLEGFIPQALALTKTLSDNEAENVFTFVYHAADPETVINVIPGQTIVVNVPGGTSSAGTGTGSNANTNRNDGTGNATDSDANDNNAAGEDDDTNVDVDSPDDLIDLDDNETPSGNLDLDDKEASGVPIAVAGVIGIGALIALIGLLLIVRKRMQSKE